MRNLRLGVLSSLSVFAVLAGTATSAKAQGDVVLQMAQPEAAILRMAQPKAAMEIGDKLGRLNSLRDIRSNRRWVEDFKGYRAFVLIFLGVECPLANLYVPGLNRLEQRYREQGVKFVAVYPNETETLHEIAAHSVERMIPYLVVKDFRQELSNTLGIDRTPQVTVLDSDMILRYRGRVDDQYMVASRKPEATSLDLEAALESLLAGEAVSVAETVSDGCLLERESALPKFDDVTYARDIAPIMQNRCQVCHRPGEIGPFPLMSFRDTSRRKTMIREVVEQRRMPPWHADPRYSEFTNDRRMSEKEIALVSSWVENGAPQGDLADLPEPIEWPSGYQIENPDAVFSIEPVDVPADGVVPYLYQYTEHGFTEDTWVVEGEIRPGDRAVVHHVLCSVVVPVDPAQLAAARAALEASGRDPRLAREYRESTVLVNWVPGQQNKIEPPGTGLKIPAGSKLRWQLHYTTNGVATTDQTSVALRFAAKPPQTETRYNTFSYGPIRIPPNAQDHEHQHSFTFREDGHLISVRPHSHLRGKNWRYEVEYPNGESEIILSVPNWDFNWQTEYFFKEPLKMPAGSKVNTFTRWDNSDNNPVLSDADRATEVRYGLQTWGEMMNGWVKYYYNKPAGEVDKK